MTCVNLGRGHRWIRFHKLNHAIKEALLSKEVETQFAKNGVYANPGTPTEFTAFLNDDMALWAKISKEGGVRLE